MDSASEQEPTNDGTSNNKQNGHNNVPNNGGGLVTDLTYCPTTMAIHALSMSPCLLTAFQSLPQQLKNVVAMTTVFRFGKRERTALDSPEDDHSPAARLYRVLLNSKGQLRGVDPLDMVGFKCVFCHSAHGPHIPGSVSIISVNANCTKKTFTVAMQHRTNHLCICPNINRLQHNAAALVRIPAALSNLATTTTDQFGEQWIRCIRKVQFDHATTVDTNLKVQLDTFSMLRVANQFWNKSVESLYKIFDDEMDVLHQSMFRPELVMEITDENDLVTLPPTTPPSKKSRIDFWIPLQCHHISPYQNDSIFFKTNESSQQMNTVRTSVRTSSYFRLHGRVDIHDVVIPTRGCTGKVVRAVYNLRGNRRFVRLVSKHRGRYASLSTKQDKIQLIHHIVKTIEKTRGGVFRSVSCRDVDGEALISKNKHQHDILAYCRRRLEDGFSDVFNICSRNDNESFTMLLSTTYDDQYVNNKVMTIEQTPLIGLLRGQMKWDGSEDSIFLKDIKREKLFSMVHIGSSTNTGKHVVATTNNGKQQQQQKLSSFVTNTTDIDTAAMCGMGTSQAIQFMDTKTVTNPTSGVVARVSEKAGPSQCENAACTVVNIERKSSTIKCV
jgi:hypothetical protein